jgi:hypothetical protein
LKPFVQDSDERLELRRLLRHLKTTRVTFSLTGQRQVRCSYARQSVEKT